MSTQLNRYAAAVLPVSPVVLGYQLQPFTIGHALLLHRMESPYLTGARLPLWGDLVLAVEICRTPAKLAEAALASGITRWRMRYLWPILLLRYSRTWQDHSLEMIGHLGKPWRSQHRPALWNKKGGQTSGVPYLLQLVVVLMDWLHMSREEAMATPILEAVWLISASAEMRDRIEFVTEDELAAMN